MRVRPQRPIHPPERRWFAPLAAVGVVALLLGWWRPWGARTAAPQPASPASATARLPLVTRTPERIALPIGTARPAPTPPPPGIGPAAATPATPGAAADLAGAGSLLYLGSVEGRGGIVAVNADGSGRRLIAPGTYEAIVWSPDGSRFAALGPLGNGEQVAIFGPDGRPLARYLFAAAAYPSIAWSPSGTYLLYASPASSTFLHATGGDAWVIDDDGARPIAPPAAGAFVYKWARDDRLTFLAHTDPRQTRVLALWLTDAAGNAPQRIYEGAFEPIGWNWLGSRLYALRYYDGRAAEGFADALIGIDLPGGSEARVNDAGAIADALRTGPFGLPMPAGSYAFESATLSPDRSLLAIVLARSAASSSRDPRAVPQERTLVLLRTYGRIEYAERLNVGGVQGVYSLSPDGTKVAHFGDQSNNPERSQLRVFDAGGSTIASYPTYRFPVPDWQPAWSPDGRWIAYESLRGLLIVAATGPARSAVLAPVGSAPAWRPGRAP